ncbi:MAG: glycoside hydrolase family 3 N-terminal domain-containing protein, partial [Leptolyngbyaceae bacterium]|nr:glycoside hydrolase family 3 N-terminal domain-containing protein [Leptolyngbyaceae bacterium]
PSFQAAIAAGVDAVMSAHLQIPAWDAQYPATLSPRILTQELRQNLGFEGLIVTDALVMGALNRFGVNQAPVLAVEAGADILLMPVDPEGAIQAVCEAVESGRISHERIQASVERIWRAKQKACSPVIDPVRSPHDWELLPPPPLQLHQLAQPEAIATVAQILQDSMQGHHPSQSRLTHPTWTQNLRNLIIVDDALGCDFLAPHTPAIALPKQLGYQLQLIDRNTPEMPINLDSRTWQPTLLQVFVRGNPFRGRAGLTQTVQTWFQALVQTTELQALVIYGSPYILQQLLPSLPTEVPYVFTYGQMPIAQEIALETLLKPLLAPDPD